MRIQNNISALNAYRQYTTNNNNISKSVEKLSSGYRINRAGDDAAGLAISEKMRAQIKGLNMASKNAQDAISLVQTAEGALQTSHNILQRMRELAVQSANDTNNNTLDREAIQLEFSQLRKEIDDTASKTEFNRKKLIDGSFTRQVMQVGANQGDELMISIAKMSSGAIGAYSTRIIGNAEGTFGVGSASITYTSDWVTVKGMPTTHTSVDGKNDSTGGPYEDFDLMGGSYSKLNKATGYNYLTNALQMQPMAGSSLANASVITQSYASQAISIVNGAINMISAQRAALGAIQNRLEYKIENLNISAENLTAAESRIRDVDMASEMTKFTKNNILSQASTAMLAQANSLPQGVLQLLGG